MAVVTTKSAPLTAMDASIISAQTKGEGAPYTIKELDGRVTAVNGDSIASKYIFCRVPSFAIVKQIEIENAAITSGAMDVGVLFAADARYIAPGQTPGGVPFAGSASFFATALSIATATGAQMVQITNESGSNTQAKRNLPLWQAIGMASDPGGKFDIVGTLTAATTAGGDITLRVEYVE